MIPFLDFLNQNNFFGSYGAQCSAAGLLNARLSRKSDLLFIGEKIVLHHSGSGISCVSLHSALAHTYN